MVTGPSWWMGGCGGGLEWCWLGRSAAGPGHGTSRGPDDSGGHAARGSSMGEHAQINERAGGPVAHGSVGRSRGSAPTSYLLVGTPLPRSRPGTGAISVAKRTAVFTIWRNASGNGRTERPARPARILRRGDDGSQDRSGGTNDVGVGATLQGRSGTRRRPGASRPRRHRPRVRHAPARSASPSSSPSRRASRPRAGPPRRRASPASPSARPSPPSRHRRPTRTGCGRPRPRRSRRSTSSRSRRSSTITGDGTYITVGPQDAMYPGPALPNLLGRPITDAGRARILAEAQRLGLLTGQTDFTADGGVPGGVTGRIELTVDGQRVTLTGSPEAHIECVTTPCEAPPGTPAAFGAFWSSLQDPAWLGDAIGPESAVRRRPLRAPHRSAAPARGVGAGSRSSTGRSTCRSGRSAPPSPTARVGVAPSPGTMPPPSSRCWRRRPRPPSGSRTRRRAPPSASSARPFVPGEDPCAEWFGPG